jgi:hypothetical protein
MNGDENIYSKVPEEPEVLKIDEVSILTYEDPNGKKYLNLLILCLCTIGLICCVVLILIAVLVVVCIINYSGNMITS